MSSRSGIQRRARVAFGCAVLLMGAVAGACTSPSSETTVEQQATTSTERGGAYAAATVPTTVAPTTAPAGGGGNAGSTGGGSGGASSGGSGGGGGGGGGASSTTAAPHATGPTITSFTTPDNIDCHNGSFQMFTASWTTTNATKVTISIDGPGVYDTYPPNGDASLPFNCSSPHTFLLTAYGSNGQTTTKSVTLQPRNVPPVSQP